MDTQTELATVKNALEDQLGFLLSKGFQYSTYSRPTKRGDKDLYFFVYDQPEKKYRFEIIYVTKELLFLKGYLINYKTKEPNHLDFENYLPFSRLLHLVPKEKMLDTNRSGFDLDVQIEKTILAVQNTQAILGVSDWIDFKVLKEKEALAYDQYERYFQRGSEWIKDILEVLKETDSLTIVYNSLQYPSHEGYGLVLSNTYGNTFLITFGYRPSATDEFAYREGLFVIEIKDINGRIGFQDIYDHKLIIPFCRKAYKERWV